MITQIYGVTTVDDAVMVAALGADHVGIVPETGPDNWDGITVDEGKAVLAALPPGTRSVVLSLGTDADRVLATARAVPGDIVHVVRTDVLELDELRAIRSEAGVPLMATVAVVGPGAIDTASRIASIADLLLLDSRDPATGIVGASGCTHDWSVSAELVRHVPALVILAGGLGPDNVADAIEQVRPWGVDSETHTSSSDDRRRKDPERVRRFLEQARTASTRS